MQEVQDVINGRCKNIKIIAGVLNQIAIGVISTINSKTGQCSKNTCCKEIIKQHPEVWETLSGTAALKVYIEYCDNPELVRKAQIKLFNQTP